MRTALVISRFLTPVVFTLAGLGAVVSDARAQTQSLYVSNGGSNTIEKFTPGLPVVGSVGTQFAGSSQGISAPFGVAFDSAGNLFTVNEGSNSIEKFASVGGVVSSVGTTFATGLSSPIGLAFDSAGDMYVANTGDGTIEKFASSGGVLSSTGTTFASGLAGPVSLAFDSAGSMYVSTLRSGIEKFAFNNGSLSSTGTGVASGSQGIAFDSAGDLFTVDYDNSRIYEYIYSGGTLSNSPTYFSSFGGNGFVFPGFGPGQSPVGLAFDSGGNLFAAFSATSTIEEFTFSHGTLSTTPTIFASSANGLQNPDFLAFSPVTPLSPLLAPASESLAAPEPTGCAVVGVGALVLGCLGWMSRQRARQND